MNVGTWYMGMKANAIAIAIRNCWRVVATGGWVIVALDVAVAVAVYTCVVGVLVLCTAIVQKAFTKVSKAFTCCFCCLCSFFFFVFGFNLLLYTQFDKMNNGLLKYIHIYISVAQIALTIIVLSYIVPWSIFRLLVGLVLLGLRIVFALQLVVVGRNRSVFDAHSGHILSRQRWHRDGASGWSRSCIGTAIGIN